MSANLTDADLTRANLSGATMSLAICAGTRLVDLDLSEVRVGETSHPSPCFLDAKTLQRTATALAKSSIDGHPDAIHHRAARGKIGRVMVEIIDATRRKELETFLRGCGVPANEIARLPLGPQESTRQR